MAKLVSINPSTREILGEVEVSTEQEIRTKVEQARKAQAMWYSMGLQERIQILRKIPGSLLRRKNELALLISREMGMPIRQSRSDVGDAMDYFNWYLNHSVEYLSPETTFVDDTMIHRVFYEPMGTAASITPWNFPVSNFVWGAGQNLIVGNTVVYKTSEEVPFCGKLIEEIVAEVGLPEGVFSEVYGGGTVGQLLIDQNIDLISFTGSSKVGWSLYEIAARKHIKIVMELGGSAPGIVFEDADLASILDTLYFNRFVNCGQACDAMKRLIVHESMFEEVVESLKKKLETVQVGNAEDEKTDIGPLVAERQLMLLESQVSDAVQKGAKIITGGKRSEGLKGYFYCPTLLINVSRDSRVWQEEVFGPVLPIVSFENEQEAIGLANNTKYGLGSYVFTKDPEQALRVASQIKTGMVSVNNASYLKPCNPFGGVKESGIGREHGKFGFNELTNIKIFAMEK